MGEFLGFLIFAAVAGVAVYFFYTKVIKPKMDQK